TACAQQRIFQPVGMMGALGIARHLGADDASGIAVVLCAAHAANGALVQQLDVERAGGRAIMRTGGMADRDIRSGGYLAHAISLPQARSPANRFLRRRTAKAR